jgi:hypothetical protein
MDYEKKYKEALERARNLKEMYPQDAPGYEEVFPELRESEDEVTRKEIIHHILYDTKGTLGEETEHRWVKYLKKQKEPVVYKEGMYYYLGGKFIYCGYPALKENPYDFAMSQQEEKQKEQKPLTNKINEYIRKSLIEYFQSFLEGHEDCYKVGGYVKWEGLDVKDILAYLEGKPDFCHHEVDFSDCSDEYRRAYYDGWNNCNQQHAQLEAERKPWSEIKYTCPETPVSDAVEVTSRMAWIKDELKPIAQSILTYAHWNLHKDEWNHPVIEVPVFRVLDALAQEGKPYCCGNCNCSGE